MMIIQFLNKTEKTTKNNTKKGDILMLGIFLFILGGMAGAILGVFTMCMVQINKAVKR